jgi:very-short-patch-repair endonuclease
VLPFSRNLKPFARELRKNMTEAERALWSKLRRKQLNGRIFYRQKNIGNYIVDFYCPGAKLIVELDGGQHYSETGKAKDEIRDEYLANLGLRVLRFSDLDVLKDMDGVLAVLYENTKSPLPPFRKGGC